MTERAVGVMLPRDLPAHLFRTYAQRAETLGFDELWVVEDCFFRGGVAQAAAALAMTERIRLGIGILPAAVRNAAFTAMEAATLAELFPGRRRHRHRARDAGLDAAGRRVAGQPADHAGRAPGRGAGDPDRFAGERRRPVRAPRRRRAEHPAEQRPARSSPVSADRGRSRSRAGPPTARSSRSRSRPEYVAEALRHIAPTREHRIVAYCVAVVDDDADAARDRRPARAGVDRRPGLGRAHRAAAVRRRVPRAAGVVGDRARRSPRRCPTRGSTSSPSSAPWTTPAAHRAAARRGRHDDGPHAGGPGPARRPGGPGQGALGGVPRDVVNAVGGDGSRRLARGRAGPRSVRPPPRVAGRRW